MKNSINMKFTVRSINHKNLEKQKVLRHFKELRKIWREGADLWGKKTLFVAAARAAV